MRHIEIDMTALRMIEQKRGVSLDRLVGAIKEALLKTYHNIPGAVSRARIEIDQKIDRVTVMAMDEDEDDDEIGEFDDTPKSFGCIARSTARSVIMQRLRGTDDQKVLGGFTSQKGQVVTGVVDQSHDRRITIIKVGDDFEAVLPDSKEAPGEAHHHGDHIQVFVVNVERMKRSARIALSRTRPGLVAGLFEHEVPEAQQSLVKTRAIARETGHRTKIIVAAIREGVNAKGACIGPMGP